jgi:hypothetical protein
MATLIALTLSWFFGQSLPKWPCWPHPSRCSGGSGGVQGAARMVALSSLVANQLSEKVYLISGPIVQR